MTIPRDTFGWVDLASTDQEAAKKFYSELFDWEAQDGPLPDGGYYTNFTKDGKAVAGLGATMAEGMPSMWSSYVLVDSADEKTKAAKEAGGQVFMEPMDVMEFGRMAFLADPSGAAFGLWEPKTHKGAEMYGDHGSLVWNELATRDLEAARPFYEKFFGWEWESMDMGEGNMYHLGGVGEDKRAGGLHMGEMWPAEVPAHWDVYFAVDEHEAAAKKAVELGATDMSGVIDVPMAGLMHYLQDPTGAFFYILQPAPRPEE
ncbi:MAG: VOC family protein [Acidimicrobiia bacterium]